MSFKAVVGIVASLFLLALVASIALFTKDKQAMQLDNIVGVYRGPVSYPQAMLFKDPLISLFLDKNMSFSLNSDAGNATGTYVLDDHTVTLTLTKVNGKSMQKWPALWKSTKQRLLRLKYLDVVSGKATVPGITSAPPDFETFSKNFDASYHYALGDPYTQRMTFTFDRLGRSVTGEMSTGHLVLDRIN